MNSAEARRQFLRLMWRNVVEPFPGRLAQTWRIALVCALTTMVSAVYGIPEAALSCYLVFFVMKPDAAEGTLLAVGLTVLVSFVVVFLVLVTHWTIDVPALRMLVLVASSLIFLYLGSASQLGELGGIIALVVVFVLTLLNDVPVGEIATRGILYAGLMAVMPMACVLVVNLTMGIKPIGLLRQTVERRLVACAQWVERPTPDGRAALVAQVDEGQEEALKRLAMTRLLALGRRAEIRRLAKALDESYRMTLVALALPSSLGQSERDELSAEIRHAARSFGRGEVFESTKPMQAEVSGEAKEMWGALHNLVGTPDRTPREAPANPFFRKDARTNPEHVRYAIKTTAAAVICYLIYTAVQWQGIHTAMITCYVAALGSVAETTHKLVLRITGCLIGAALGIGSILFVMPHITSVGAIMVLVFLGTFISAWVWVGNERVSYAGVQVGLAFLLTVLQGFGPTFDMDTARDRVVGVLLGNCVLYLVFTRLWPVSVARRAWESLSRSIALLAAMGQSTGSGSDSQAARDLRISYASKIAAQLAEFRWVLSLTYFEAASRRPSASHVLRSARIAVMVRAIAAQWVRQPPAEDGHAQRLERLAQACAAAPDSLDGKRLALNAMNKRDEQLNSFERDIRSVERLVNGR